MSAEAAALIPITVLTGFLGSGKTTLLNHLLHQPDMDETAVLINEFGEIGLDHALVEAVDGDVVLLSSGCLCCTIRSDLVTALRDLWFQRVRGDVPDFRRLVIETTGLADPAPILHTLMTDALVSARYRLDGIVTTVDAVNAPGHMDRQPEAVKQVAVADRLVLTKTDLCAEDSLVALRRRLRVLNPGAPLVAAPHGRVSPTALLDAGLFNAGSKHPDVAGWLRDEAIQAKHHGHGHGHDHTHEHEHEHPSHDVTRHDAHIGSFVLTYERPVDWESFVAAMELLVTQKGENVLRVKGLLHVRGEDQPVVVHGVQHIFHPPVHLDAWPDGDRRSRLVFITRDLGREAVASLFDSALA
jgi:G3E family GTPase